MRGRYLEALEQYTREGIINVLLAHQTLFNRSGTVEGVGGPTVRVVSELVTVLYHTITLTQITLTTHSLIQITACFDP